MFLFWLLRLTIIVKPKGTSNFHNSRVYLRCYKQNQYVIKQNRRSTVPGWFLSMSIPCSRKRRNLLNRTSRTFWPKRTFLWTYCVICSTVLINRDQLFLGTKRSESWRVSLGKVWCQHCVFKTFTFVPACNICSRARENCHTNEKANRK